MNRLKFLREAKGVSQKEIARYIDKSPQAYNFYENGHREPDIATIKKLADYFAVSIDYILGYIPKSDNKKNRINSDELDLIKKYRQLNEDRQEAIRDFINTSYEKTIQTQKNTDEIVS